MDDVIAPRDSKTSEQSGLRGVGEEDTPKFEIGRGSWRWHTPRENSNSMRHSPQPLPGGHRHSALRSHTEPAVGVPINRHICGCGCAKAMLLDNQRNELRQYRSGGSGTFPGGAPQF